MPKAKANRPDRPVIVNFEVPQELKKRIRVIASREKRSMASLLRHAVTGYLKDKRARLPA